MFDKMTIYDKTNGKKVDVNYFDVRIFVYSTMLGEMALAKDATNTSSFVAGCLVGCATEHMTILFNKENDRTDYDKEVLKTFFNGIHTLFGKDMSEQEVKELIEDLTEEFLTNENYIVLSAV